MPYELRIAGKTSAQFETEQEAVEAAKEVLFDDPNADPEVIDLSTGHAAAPGASKRWREELRNKVGF
jgi:hypothetical protein